MAKRKPFNFEDRVLFEKMINEKFTTFRDLARRVNRDRSSLRYELVRSGFLTDPIKYNALVAQKAYDAKKIEQSLRMRGEKADEDDHIKGLVTRIENLEFQLEIFLEQFKIIEGKLNGKND